MRESGKSLAELHRDLTHVSAGAGQRAGAEGLRLGSKHQAIAKARRAAERSLGGRGRVLLRPSGTEPVLRVMVEGEPREAIESAAKSIADTVRKAAAA